MSTLSKNVLRYGSDEPLPEWQRLRAGPLSMVFEPEGAFLRYIRLGDVEVLRGIYAAVRDHNWGTVLPSVSNIQLDTTEDTFELTFDVECVDEELGVDFYWKGTITGDAEGTVAFTMDGEARSTFLRNRIGFCVLHPGQECAGQPCTVEHVDDTTEEGEFPRYISPHQPFMDMRAITHEVMPGVQAEVRFAGDIFEMEDQRNWTDASYKTYCTPLAMPFPVKVDEGTKIWQSITLSLHGDVPDVEPMEEDARLIFSVGDSPAGPLPRIGLCVASHGNRLSETELDRLAALGFAHLRADLHLSDPGYEDELRQAVAQAGALGAELEIAIHLSDDAENELQSLATLLEEAKPPVAHWLVFHEAEKSTTEKWVQLAREYLADYDPATKIGTGTNAFFTELNRGRPPVEVSDLVTYSINPQVHAFDNASLVETLEAQASTVESARQFSGGLPLVVSPVTFKMRFNPNATGPEPEPAPGELPSQVDERQMSLFGAGWTAGSLKYLSESGLYGVTYYETTGWRGAMETEDGSPVPEKFQSLPGGVFPLYHVLADIGEFAGGRIVPTTSSDTLKVDGLAVQKDGQLRVTLANLTDEPQEVTVENLAEQVSVHHLHDTNAEEAMVSPEEFRADAGEPTETTSGTLELRLLPYAIARIDSE